MDTLNMQEIRKWASAQGMKVGVRGPLSLDIINAYFAAHKTVEQAPASWSPGE